MNKHDYRHLLKAQTSAIMSKIEDLQAEIDKLQEKIRKNQEELAVPHLVLPTENKKDTNDYDEAAKQVDDVYKAIYGPQYHPIELPPFDPNVSTYPLYQADPTMIHDVNSGKQIGIDTLSEAIKKAYENIRPTEQFVLPDSKPKTIKWLKYGAPFVLGEEHSFTWDKEYKAEYIGVDSAVEHKCICDIVELMKQGCVCRGV